MFFSLSFLFVCFSFFLFILERRSWPNWEKRNCPIEEWAKRACPINELWAVSDFGQTDIPWTTFTQKQRWKKHFERQKAHMEDRFLRGRLKRPMHEVYPQKVMVESQRGIRENWSRKVLRRADSSFTKEGELIGKGWAQRLSKRGPLTSTRTTGSKNGKKKRLLKEFAIWKCLSNKGDA